MACFSSSGLSYFLRAAKQWEEKLHTSKRAVQLTAYRPHAVHKQLIRRFWAPSYQAAALPIPPAAAAARVSSLPFPSLASTSCPCSRGWDRAVQPTIPGEPAAGCGAEVESRAPIHMGAGQQAACRIAGP